MPRDVTQFCRLPQELVDIVIAQLRGDKKALKACSLVCWAWSIPSAPLLHEELKWPPCSWQESCEKVGLDAQDGSYTILLEALVASSRIRESVRVLRIKTHRYGCTHAHENDGSLIPTVFRLLTFLPHLRSLTLLIDDIDITSAEDLEPERQLSLAIDDLNLHCPPQAVPALLSPFEHVSKLSLRSSHNRNAEGEVAPPSRPIAPIVVHSIDAHQGAVSVLPILRHIVDPAAVHTLVLDYAPTFDQPEVLAFVRSLQSLKSLEYRQVIDDGVPFGDGLGQPSLRSVAVGGGFSVRRVEPLREHFDEEELEDYADVPLAPLLAENVDDIRGGGLGDSEWGEILRDLRVLVTRGTEEVTIKLHIRQWRPPRLGSDNEDEEFFVPEDGARALRKALSLLDWAGLEAVVRQSAAFRSLRFVISGNDLATTDLTADLLLDAFGTHLADDVAAKLHVVRPSMVIPQAIRHDCCSRHSQVVI